MEEPKSNILILIISVFALLSSLIVIFFYNTKDSIILGCFNFDHPISESKFKDDLHLMIMKVAVNDNTNRRDIIMFVTNAGMLKLTRNALCSLWKTNIVRDRIIVVATDKISYLNMLEFGANTVYFPNEQVIKPINPSNDNEFVELIKAKFKAVKFVVQNTTDVTLSDSDIVFFSNPLIAFSFDTDIEASIDSITEPVLPSKDPSKWGLNLNFAHYQSTPILRSFMNIWEEKIEQFEYTESQALLELINNLPISRSYGDTLTIKLNQYTLGLENPSFKIRYVNPVFGVEAKGPVMGSSTLKRVFWKEARKINMSSPLWCHFGGLGSPSQKAAKMQDYNLWFLDESDHCLETLPKGLRKPLWS